MMNYIWAGMIVLSFAVALFTGNGAELSESVVGGATKAVELLISILGIICFWSGMMEVAKRSGLTDLLARLFSPMLRLLFPNVPKESPAMKSMSLNISANLLGLGNAATPFGIEAMRELKKLNHDDTTASDDMVLFVVLNTASLQLIPTTLGAYRQSFGSNSPFDILPAVWVTSVMALIVGVVATRAVGSLHMGKREREIKMRKCAWN